MKKALIKGVVLLMIATLIILSSVACGVTEPGTNGNNGACIGHTDINDDEVCDICESSVVAVFDIYALNDLHGKLDDTSSCVGVDELSTYLNNASAENSKTVILSSGDMWQGSAESNLTKGIIVTEWMNEMNFVSMTLGNHEFDWGIEYILENAEIADFEILAINVYDSSTGKRASFCEASVIVERDGVKVGIIGAIGNCRSSISSSLIEGYDFKVGNELTSLVKEESQRLRELGCELIIYSIHDGNENYSSTEYPSESEMRSYYDVSLSNGYVDVVFEGHSHNSYVHVDKYGVYHLQNGGYDNGISHVELKVNTVKDTVSVSTAEIVENNEYGSLDDDPIIDELLSKYDEYISMAREEIGFNSELRDADFIRQLVASLYLTRGLEKWGDKYNIVLGGGFISARDPGMLPVGTLQYYDVMSVLPFDNEIFLCTINGYKLKRQFMYTSNSNYFVAYSSYGLSIEGNINDNQTYYIIADKYSVDYAYNGLTAVESLGSGIFARDLLADYARKGELDTSYPTLTIPEALAIGDNMAHNTMTAELYYVDGTVVEITGLEYGNMFIEDIYGNRIYVYGVYDESMNRYDKMTDPPKVGDRVRFLCHVSNYNGPQLKNAIVITIF